MDGGGPPSRIPSTVCIYGRADRCSMWARVGRSPAESGPRVVTVLVASFGQLAERTREGVP